MNNLKKFKEEIVTFRFSDTENIIKIGFTRLGNIVQCNFLYDPNQFTTGYQVASLTRIPNEFIPKTISIFYVGNVNSVSCMVILDTNSRLTFLGTAMLSSNVEKGITYIPLNLYE